MFGVIAIPTSIKWSADLNQIFFPHKKTVNKLYLDSSYIFLLKIKIPFGLATFLCRILPTFLKVFTSECLWISNRYKAIIINIYQKLNLFRFNGTFSKKCEKIISVAKTISCSPSIVIQGNFHLSKHPRESFKGFLMFLTK